MKLTNRATAKCRFDRPNVIATTPLIRGEQICLYYGKVVDTPIDELDWATAVRSIPSPDGERTLVPTVGGLPEKKAGYGHLIRDAGYMERDRVSYEALSEGNCTVFLNGILQPYNVGKKAGTAPTCYRVYAIRPIAAGEVLYMHRGLEWWKVVRGQYEDVPNQGDHTGALWGVNDDVLSIIVGHLPDHRLIQVTLDQDRTLYNLLIRSQIVWYYNLCNMGRVTIPYDASCDYEALWRAFCIPSVDRPRNFADVLDATIDVDSYDEYWHPSVLTMLAAMITSERETCRYRPDGLGTHVENAGSSIYIDDVSHHAEPTGVWGMNVMSAILSRGCMPLLEVMLDLDYGQLDRTWNATIPHDVIYAFVDGLTELYDELIKNKTDDMRRNEVASMAFDAMTAYWNRLGGVVRNYVEDSADNEVWNTLGLTRYRIVQVWRASSVTSVKALMEDVLISLGITPPSQGGRIPRITTYIRNHDTRSIYLHTISPEADVPIDDKSNRGDTYAQLYRSTLPTPESWYGWFRGTDYDEDYVRWCVEWCHRSGVDPPPYGLHGGRVGQRIRSLDRGMRNAAPLPASSSYIVIDTETTGLIPDGHTLHNLVDGRTVRITEIAWEIVVNGRLVRSEGYILPGSPVKEMEQYMRVSWSEVVYHLQRAMNMVTHIVMHNAYFDMRMIMSELLRGKWKEGRLVDAILDKTVIDTLYSNQEKGKRGRKVKLGELHRQLFGVDFPGAHRALADVKATRRCYEALVGLPPAIEEKGQ